MERSEPLEGGDTEGAAGKHEERSWNPEECELYSRTVGSFMLASLGMVLTVRVVMSGSAPVRESSVHIHETEKPSERGSVREWTRGQECSEQ